MQKTINIKGFKPSEDGKTTFIYDDDGSMAIYRGTAALKIGEAITVGGENKTSKAGKPYFNITSMGQPAPAAPPIYPPEAPKEAPKPEAKPYKDDKNSAFALSYAKDLAVAGVIPKEDILSWAEAFKRYLNGDLGVTDSQVLKVIMADKVVKK